MKKAYILASKYLNYDGNNIAIGGVETYISKLVKILIEMDFFPIIIQYSNYNFSKLYEKYNIIGLKTKSKKKLYKYVEKIADFKEDLLIFSTDYMNVKNKFLRSITIQHGIAWDYSNKKIKNVNLNIIINSIKSIYRIKRTNYSKFIIAVDYNYVNWLRAQTQKNYDNIYVIPNFVEIKNIEKRNNNNKINIMFARRFEKYRGTRLFAESIKEILNIRNNVYVSFAGEGSDSMYLKNFFKNEERVNFFQYNANLSLEIHKNYDIAVVPSLASEGTTLSILEAMAAKCAVIATNVGGITNIILDNYNGIIVNPNKDELINAILTLVDNEKIRDKISKNAFLTVKESFSYTLWREKWFKILNKIINS